MQQYLNKIPLYIPYIAEYSVQYLYIYIYIFNIIDSIILSVLHIKTLNIKYTLIRFIHDDYHIDHIYMRLNTIY